MYSTNTNNNFFVPHQVTEDIKFLDLPISAKWLYTILCKLANRHADKDGWFWRSIPQLMNDTKLKRRTVILDKKLLKEHGFINIERTFMVHSKNRTYDSFKLNGFRCKK